jgi:hypothetical protein
MSHESDKNSSDDPIEELKSILDDVEQKGEEISEKGRGITKDGQYRVDIARATKAVIPYLPPNEIENIIGDWKPFAQQSERLLLGLQGLDTEVRVDSATYAGTATLSITGSFPNLNPYTSAGFVTKNPEARAAFENLQAVAGRFIDASQVERILQELGFDKAYKGKKSPLELFQTAQGAFEKPVINKDPIITSLIPIRECIHLIIAELLKRRPIQEETRGDYAKVVSISRQLKRDTIQIDVFDSLARQWHDEIRDKELSAAKEGSVQREEWLRRLQRATQFLFSLLSGLDPAKMKHR